MFGYITDTDRPSKGDLTAKEFALQMGRYAVSTGFNSTHNNWVDQYYTNMLFFFDNQWIVQEDLEAFLKDDSDQSRNRIKVKKNMILPTVAQYIGNAISMDITVRCKAMSPRAVNRRERKLEEMLFIAEVAESSMPIIREEFKKIYGIGDSVEETERMFNNLWQDNYVRTMNMLMEYISEINDFGEKKKSLAQNLALSGLATMKYEPHNGEMKWDVVPPERFFFDRTAIKQDLSDAEYMGEYEYMLPSAMYELYPEAKNYRKEIERSVVAASTGDANSQTFIRDGKIPVFKVYWIDSEPFTYGYVIDEFGYPYYCKIDYVEKGAEKPKYTKKDVIPYKDLNESQKKMVDTNGVAVKYFDCVKYVVFIAKETISLGGVNEYTDVVLEHGDMPYQDTEYYRFASVKFPYKNYCWYYNNGFIFSPVSALINPQRMINRFESVKENLVNTALPGVVAYDKGMLNPDGGEEEMLRNLYQGKPIGLAAKNMGVQNAIQRVGSSLDVNSIQAYDLMSESMRMAMDRIIGVNDSMKGQSQGSEQLVGVTALQIQRASLIQEPYYDAIAKLFEQVYQSSANVGKRIYADNERDLSVAVGDGSAQIIKLTKEFNNEDFRAVIHRQPSLEQQKQVANGQIMQFAQIGWLDKQTASILWNNSTPDDVAEALRMSAKVDVEVAVRQQAMQQQQQAQLQSQQEGLMAEQILEKNQERVDKLAENQKDRDAKREINQDQVIGKIAMKQMDIQRQPMQ